MSETTDYTERTDWGAVAAAFTFESLVVASRSLAAAHLAETIFYFTTKNTKLEELTSLTA
jgi:hypothetical protein